MHVPEDGVPVGVGAAGARGCLVIFLHRVCTLLRLVNEDGTVDILRRC